MKARRRPDPTPAALAAQAERVRLQAITACRYRSFAELTAVVIACQFLKRGRQPEARRLILSYLRRHASTPRVAAVLRLCEKA